AAARGADETEHPVRGDLEVEPIDRPQVAVGMAQAAKDDRSAGRLAGRGRASRGELLGFRAHIGILAQPALLTKEVRKVDKHPARNPIWTRQSSSSVLASACSSA